MSKNKDICAYGRSFTEYCQMFGLSGDTPPASVVGVGDGVSNFNAEATRRGWRAVSVDPIYELTAAEIEHRYRLTLTRAMAGLARNRDNLIWRHYESPEALLAHRHNTMNDFLVDFETGLQAGRYLPARLPTLPFASGQFDIGLSSHLLFVWSDVLDLDFHIQSITEMLRVAREVRIWPTSTKLSRQRCEYVDTVMRHFRHAGFCVRDEHAGGPGNHAGAERLILRRNR